MPTHQNLTEQNCMACHSEDAGPRLLQRSCKPFSHELMRSAVREQCQTFHCAPTDKLHGKITGHCSQRLTQNAWKPGNFNHEKSFALGKDHNVECVTCHVSIDYSRYTCYGRHEHTVQDILREHRDEGIHDLHNCVRCH